jgi:HTH-type transcriptional regulator/antitoxin HigA
MKPIRDEQEYERALAEIERLFDAEADTPEGDRLEVLTILVEHYEDRRYAAPLPDPIEAIEYHLDSRGLTRRDLEPYIGTRARVSEILNRRRPLTLRMIRKLQAGLGIPAEILIQPYELAADSTPDHTPESSFEYGPIRQSASALAEAGLSEHRPSQPET